MWQNGQLVTLWQLRTKKRKKIVKCGYSKWAAFILRREHKPGLLGSAIFRQRLNYYGNRMLFNGHVNHLTWIQRKTEGKTPPKEAGSKVKKAVFFPSLIHTSTASLLPTTTTAQDYSEQTKKWTVSHSVMESISPCIAWHAVVGVTKKMKECKHNYCRG